MTWKHSAHELDGPAVEDLLLEIVPFRLVLEGELDHTRARGPDGLCDGEHDLAGIPGGVVLHAHAAVDPLAPAVLVPDKGARSVGNEEHRVHVLGRPDGAVEDVEAVAEAEGLPRAQVRLDVLPVGRGLGRVCELDEEDVGLLHRIGDRH